MEFRVDKFVFISLIFYVLIIVVCSANCKKNILEKKLTRSERSKILKVHNNIRLLITKGKVSHQPQGINLKRLKWDNRLSKAAQKIANKCKFKHASVKDGRWYVGQNLFKQSSTAYTKGLNVTEAIYAWFNEHYMYKFPKYTKETGHYSQLVWADTKYVGCGYTHYKTGGKFKYHKLLVCNYGPGGNVQGQAPYEIGYSNKKSCKNVC